MGLAWMDRAACQPQPGEPIVHRYVLDNPTSGRFPIDTRIRMEREYFKDQLAVCATCPVTDECLHFGIQLRDHLGVYGGLTPSERNLPARTRREQVAS